MQAARPRAIVDLIRSGEQFRVKLAPGEVLTQPGTCERCGYISSQPVCKACVLLEGLNKGLPRLGISKSKAKRPITTKTAEVAENGCEQQQQKECCEAKEECRQTSNSVCTADTSNSAPGSKGSYLSSKQAIAAHPSARS